MSPRAINKQFENVYMTTYFFETSDLELLELKNQSKSYCCIDKSCYGYGYVNYGNFLKRKSVLSSYSKANKFDFFIFTQCF